MFDYASDYELHKRLDEISGQLQDWHISAYKSDLLLKEKVEIETELANRTKILTER